MYSWVGNSGGWMIFEGPSGTHINVPLFLYNNDSTFGFDVTGALAPPPNIASQPTGGTVQPGQTMALTVDFSGPPAIGLQWYVGQPGDTSNPIAGAIESTLTPPAPSSTTTYWARITNLWGSVDTLGATITVAYTSNLPVILTQPQQIYDLWYDAYDALTVFAVGPGPLAYQWYQNNVAVSGATSEPARVESRQSGKQRHLHRDDFQFQRIGHVHTGDGCILFAADDHDSTGEPDRCRGRNHKLLSLRHGRRSELRLVANGRTPAFDSRRLLRRLCSQTSSRIRPAITKSSLAIPPAR